MRLYHYLDSHWALVALQNARLKISLIHETNDPFELRAGNLQNAQDRRQMGIMIQHACDISGMLCFSDGWQNPVMWSHYGDRHRGVAFAFEVDGTPDVYPVVYAEKRSSDLVERILRGNQDEREAAGREWMSTKYIHWRYESEYRMFTSRKDEEAVAGKHFFDFYPHLQLKAVLLGVRFSGTRDHFERALHEKYPGTEIVTTRMAFKSYSIVRQKLKKPWFA